MKYYLIAGEASGDLHASHLMTALREEDSQAEFRFFGGDKMQAQGGTMVCHYKELAYMGFVDVALHLRTILKGMKRCKDDILSWNPDVVILVDYPGFNLKIARFVHDNTNIPVFYYISPKIWAWKERRIKEIRRNVNELFSILPFEVDFFEGKHNYPIHYVGNPTVDEVDAFLKENPDDEIAKIVIDNCSKSSDEMVKIEDDPEDEEYPISSLPKKAAIVIDKSTGSSAESLVRFAKMYCDTTRTKVYGKENTWGAQYSGNIIGTPLPNSQIWVYYPTFISSLFLSNDSDSNGSSGLSPDVRINLPYPKKLTDNCDEWILWISYSLMRKV